MSGPIASRFPRRLSALTLALMCFGCTSGPTAREQALIAEAEKRVQLPKGAGKLQCYKRYYIVLRGKQWKELFGGPSPPSYPEFLVGTYQEPGPREMPGIRWVTSMKDIPRLDDAGCQSMTVWYPAEWPGEKVKALCALDFSGNMPEEIQGKPLTC